MNSNIKFKKKKLKTLIVSLALITTLSTIYMATEKQDEVTLVISEKDNNDYYAYLRKCIASNKTLDESKKEELYYFTCRYIDTMDYNVKDIIEIGNKIKMFDFTYDNINNILEVLFKCNDIDLQDLKEYFYTSYPISYYGKQKYKVRNGK